MNYCNRSIIELCFPLFQFVYNMNDGSLDLDFQELQSKILHEFFVVEESLKSVGISDAVCNDIKFVMSAFLDEMILKRGDERSGAWSKDSLQSRFFKENLGGEKFFERLSYLQKFSDKRFDILELYYWCLELGYEGKYHRSDSQDLKIIKDNLRALLKPNQVSRYVGLDLKKMSMPVGVRKKVKFRNKVTLKYFLAAVFLGGAAVYGIQVLSIQYLLRGLKVFTVHLV